MEDQVGAAAVEVVADSDPAKGLAAHRITLSAYGVELGPLAHLRAERDRLDGLTWQHFDVMRMGATIGAEISGVDLTQDLPAPVIAEIRDALLNFKVIFFRDQPLSAEQHVAFARRFGELEIHPFIPSTTGVPELVRFEKGEGTPGYENGWHHDVTWRAEPSMGAILRAVHVPPSGGDTLFADMAAAYEGLDDDLRTRIDSMVAVHDFMLAFGRQLTPENEAEMREKYPLVEHPVVRTHPETGRRLIYVNPYFTHHIKGMDVAEGRALVGELSRLANTVEYQCRFRWENNSVAFWDNRIVQHYAASDYWPQKRIVERASIIGDRPV